MDVAEAAQVFAQSQKLGEEAINYAHQIYYDAFTQLGTLLRKQPKNKGSRGQLRHDVVSGSVVELPTRDSTPTLDSLGITKKQSMNAQQFAALEEEVRHAVATKQLSLTAALRKARHGTFTVPKCHCPLCGDRHVARHGLTLENLGRKGTASVPGPMKPEALVVLQNNMMARELAVTWQYCGGNETEWLNTAVLSTRTSDMEAISLCRVLRMTHICRDGGITDPRALRYIEMIATKPIARIVARRTNKSSKT
jgi:hypothetical protein